MSEYDYSGLYNSPQNSGPAGSGQPAASDQPIRQEGGYPNVGSSGMNTANTARTDYSTASGSQPAGEAQQPETGASFHSYADPAGWLPDAVE